MRIIQELGFALAILFALIGYMARKHDYKVISIISYIIAVISFILFGMGWA